MVLTLTLRYLGQDPVNISRHYRTIKTYMFICYQSNIAFSVEVLKLKTYQ